MNTTLLKRGALMLALIFPMLPLGAHAETTAVLTGDTGIHLGGSAVANGNASGTATHTNVSAAASGDASVTGTPIFITHDGARATMSGSGSLTETTALTSAQMADITSQTALRAHANVVAASDANIGSLSLSSDKVSVSYREPARLLGFIHITVPVTVSVDAKGSTRLSYPWYNFLLSTNEAGLSIRAQAAVNTALATDATARADATARNTTATTSGFAHATTNANVAASAGLSIAAQARLLDSIHAALKSTAEASTSASTK